MRILYLYSELMGYQIPIFKEYVDQYGAEVHVIHWNLKKMTPYIPPLIENVFYYNRSEFEKMALLRFVTKICPDVVYISGWMDSGYLIAARHLRKRGVPVVSGFDSIWKKALKQRFAAVLFPLIKDSFFSHAWIAGPYQYEFVKQLGFKNHQIIHNCLCANIGSFNDAYNNAQISKLNKYPHRFLYVGRLEYVKGVDLLLQAWSNIKEFRKDWDLCIIGNGSIRQSTVEEEKVVIRDFMQPELVADEIINAGCFVLPSRSEPWGLVLHEFSAGGLPIICSRACGAAPIFVISGYNGFTFTENSLKALEESLLKIINTPDKDLLQMSINSHVCGQRITPELSAASFMSVIA